VLAQGGVNIRKPSVCERFIGQRVLQLNQRGLQDEEEAPAHAQLICPPDTYKKKVGPCIIQAGNEKINHPK
jgi:hypothetical protein